MPESCAFFAASREALRLSSTAVTRCFARARGRANRPLPLYRSRTLSGRLDADRRLHQAHEVGGAMDVGLEEAGGRGQEARTERRLLHVTEAVDADGVGTEEIGRGLVVEIEEEPFGLLAARP